MKSLLAIGCYMDGEPFFSHAQGKGIVFAEFDHETGHITSRQIFRDILNPSYLTGNLCGRWASVADNLSAEGQVFLFDAKGESPLENSPLHPVWKAPSGGRASCHLTFLPKPDAIAVVSYSDGCVAILDAKTGKLLQKQTWEGSGPVTARQEASHPHQAMPSPCGNWLYIPDLGMDCLHVGKLHATHVDFDSSFAIPLPPGTGPRHLVFHPAASIFYVVGELDGVVHPIERKSHQVEVHPGVKTIDAYEPGRADASAIRIHPRLPLLYVANRCRQEIAVLDISSPLSPKLCSTFPCGGDIPRDMELSPCGNWLLAACQNSHAVWSHPLHAHTGLPMETPPTAFSTGSPVALLLQKSKHKAHG